MATIREHLWLDASADTVWKLVGNPAAVHEWVPSLRSCRMDGSTRSCELARGGVVVEEILVVDDSQRRLQYGVRDGLPVERHLGTVDVIANGSGTSLLIYGTDVSPDAMAKPVRSAIRASLEVLASTFGTTPPG
jgi:uncharacterized protein YndB with AHSA1/START domain